MKVLVLNGAGRLRELAAATVEALTRFLEASGDTVAATDLATVVMPDCRGDLGCWTVTPGECVHAGAHRELAREIVRSDLLVLVTPVTFGGYSSLLKRLLDHCVPLVSPFFTRVAGETHHVPRYARFPSLLAVALTDGSDGAGLRVFERLVERNVRNMWAPHYGVVSVEPRDLPDLDARVPSWIRQLAARFAPCWPDEPLALDPVEGLTPVTPEKVLLLVGSPRGAASTSAVLATHLDALLVARGVASRTVDLPAALRRDPLLRLLGSELGESDVVALVAPLYVDSLPAAVTRALEVLAGHGPRPGLRPRLMAIVNCGFPEAVHCDTALGICRLFAARAGLDWVGGLAVGGGGMIGGRPLARLGRRASHLTDALAMTADALAVGRAVPAEAQALVRRPTVPAWLYRRAADLGMWREAWRHGAAGRLNARPYA